METTLLFWISSLILVGLCLCRSEKVSDANGSYEDWATEILWTKSSKLIVLYKLSNLLGKITVIVSAAYLTFSEHWWYCLAYIGTYVGAVICAFILQLLIQIIFKPIMKQDRVRVCRIIGSLMILTFLTISIVSVLL
jgi:hypothetical protein